MENPLAHFVDISFIPCPSNSEDGLPMLYAMHVQMPGFEMIGDFLSKEESHRHASELVAHVRNGDVVIHFA